MREKYAAGFWSYALGDPACDHPRYEEACATAVEDGWDPWWIRTRQDVEAVLAGCWFDEKAAVRVCKFIEKLVLPKGKWRGKTMVLMDWQRFDAVMPLYGWQIWSDEHERPVRRYVKGCIWIPKKNGKALALDTPIPTPHGWTTMGDIRAGDTVFDEHGNPCRVRAVAAVEHNRPCYRVVFSDGTSIVADAEHEWLTRARRTCGKHGDQNSGPVGIRTTKEIAEHVRVEWRGSEGYNHSIPVFRLPRKVARLKHRPNKHPRSQTLHIVAAEPVESVPVRCIEVDSPSHLYLAGPGMVPTHNSGLCSSLGLYHLRGDREGAPRVWVASVSHKTAGNIHDVSRQIVHKTPGLYPDLRPIDSTKVITYKKEDGSFVAMSADADVQEGEDWSAGFFDEVHVGIRKLWSSLAGGGAARVQPLMLAASTAGEFDPVSLGWEQWEVSRKIREGALIDIEYFALQYYGDETRWEDWEVIERANPSLGITCGLRYMQGRLNDARASDHGRSDFLRYNLNVWVTATTRWLPMSVWLRCSKVQDDESLAAYLDSLKGQRCYGGLDLSLSDDLTAFVLWFPPCDRFDKPRVWPWFWLPEENILALQDANQAPYVEWARRGLMELTPGNWVDTRRVRERLLKAREEYRIEEVAYDPYKMTELAQALQDEDGFQMVEHPQTIKTMGPPTREVERLIRTGEMEHGNHPILNWMLGNCQLRRTYQDDYQIVKADTKVRYKVDGIVAMIMAADRWIRNPVSALPLVM